MKIRYSDKDRIFNIHTDAIPYLSFDMLDRLGVPNLYSTRFLSYVPGSEHRCGSDDDLGSDSGSRCGHDHDFSGHDRGCGGGREREHGAVDTAGIFREGLRTAVMNWETVEEAAPVCRANRDRLARQLGSSIAFECITDQKHTNYVHVASREDFGTSTSGNNALHRQYVDGIVTDIPEALLTVFGADCPTVYIVDPVHRAIGLVHAGWRGTLGKIPEVAIAQMVVRFDCEPSDMYAAIGPGICRDCYEMGDEIYDIFADKWGGEDADRLLVRYPAADKAAGIYHLDLREANRLTLLRAGVPADHIAVSNVCTMCNADVFYSYRAHRMENEQAAMLVNRFDR